MPLPFNRSDLSDRLSDAASRRVITLLQQMLIKAIRVNPQDKECNDEREDSIDPP